MTFYRFLSNTTAIYSNSANLHFDKILGTTIFHGRAGCFSKKNERHPILWPNQFYQMLSLSLGLYLIL